MPALHRVFPRCAIVLQTLLAVPIAALAVSGTAHAQMPPNPPVQVATPLKDQVIDYDIFTGRFVAADSVELRARVSGYLYEQRFEDGALVSEGDVLFVIDQRPFVNAVASARAAVASAEAGRELAQIELDRALQLAERNVGTVQEVDRTRASLTQADAEVQVANAELISAQLDLDYTTITAPFDGRISAGTIDVGNLVVGGTSGTTLLATLVRISPIDFEFTASEADFLRYARMIPIEQRPSRSGARMAAAIQVQDEEGFPNDAYLDFVDNRLNPNSGTIQVRAVVEDPPDILVPGLFGRIRLEGSGPFEALLVPDEAILSDQATKIVMTVNAEGIVQPMPVILGPLHRGLRAVTGGPLSADMKVIVTGVLRARPGAGVTPEEITLEFRDDSRAGDMGGN
ncbi:MAG: efflux RND transporter periplasmic adaptor subunit [Pseudomonadota bacterium]